MEAEYKAGQDELGVVITYLVTGSSTTSVFAYVEAASKEEAIQIAEQFGIAVLCDQCGNEGPHTFGFVLNGKPTDLVAYKRGG